MASKEVLIELLKQTFADRLNYIEKRSQEEIDSLNFTKKEFEAHRKKIEGMVKMKTEKEQKDKEKCEKERLIKLTKAEKDKKEKRDKSIGPKENGRKSLPSMKASPSMASFTNRKTIGSTTDRRGTITSLNTSTTSKRASTPGRKTTNSNQDTNKKLGRTSNKQTLNKSSTIAQLNGKNPFDSTNKNTITNSNNKGISTKASAKIVPKLTFVDLRKSQFFVDILYFLSNDDKLHLFSTNKRLFLPDLISLISDYQTKLNENNNILIGQTIEDKIRDIQEVSIYIYASFNRHKVINSICPLMTLL